jgi:hypothetical protein
MNAVTVIETFAGSPLVVEDDPEKKLVNPLPDVKIVSAGLFSNSDIISYNLDGSISEGLPEL